MRKHNRDRNLRSDGLDWFCCVDCDLNTSDGGEYYMLTDEVWKSTRMQPAGGMLCIGCVEHRIGRTLTASDFASVPLNCLTYGMSQRLKQRLTATKSAPIRGVAYVERDEYGNRKRGYETGYMVWISGEPRPHTGPLSDRADALALANRLNSPTYAQTSH